MGEDIMDYTDRCRLCIAGSKRLSIDIFSPEGKRSKLQSKISKYLSVKISEDDKLPSSICYQCLFRVETWVSFKKHCLDSDQTLKNWAFFCGAITPESYLNEANKSSENSDVEKPTSAYVSSKDNDARHRTSPRAETTAPGPSHTPPRTVLSPSALLSSSSSSSSQRRGSEAGEKSSSKATANHPLNGVTREPAVRTSKSGRRKILRPSKAFITGKGDDHQIQLITVERKVEVQISPSSRKSEDSKLPKELPQKQTSPTLLLPFKRKRGRPSKAWLRERAEALQKLKEAAQTQQEVSHEIVYKEENEQKKPKEIRELREAEDLKEAKEVKEAKELRELKEAKELRELKEAEELRELKKAKELREAKVLRYEKELREAKALRYEKKLREAKALRAVKELKDAKEKEANSSKSKNMTEMVELDDPDFGSMMFTLSVIDSSAVPTSEKSTVYPESSTSVSSGRLSSDSCFKEEFSGFSNPNLEAKRAEDEGTSSKVVGDGVVDQSSEHHLNETCDKPVSPQRTERKRSHSALGQRSCEESEEKVQKLEETTRSVESLKADDSKPAAITAFSVSSSDQLTTEVEICSAGGEQLSCNEPIFSESHCQDGIRRRDVSSPTPPDIDREPSSYGDSIDSLEFRLPTRQSVPDTKDDHPLDDDDESDSDAAAPPMSPLSPARINFQVNWGVELGEERDTDNDTTDDLE